MRDQKRLCGRTTTVFATRSTIFGTALVACLPCLSVASLFVSAPLRAADPVEEHRTNDQAIGPIIDKNRNNPPSSTGTTERVFRPDGARGQSTGFPPDEVDKNLDFRAKQLAARIRAAKADELGPLRRELVTITERQFEHRQQRRQQEFESLSQRVESLKASYRHRQQNKADVIQRRVNELLEPNSDLHWDSVEPPVDEKDGIGRNPKTRLENNANLELEEVTEAEHQTSSTVGTETGIDAAVPTTAASKPDEPTYNGVAYSKWMKMLETERNPVKLVEAVLAMGEFVDYAEPRYLTRAALRLMRVNRRDSPSNSNLNMSNAVISLLSRLPCEIVVEELNAELRQSPTLEPTRDFAAEFLRYVGNGQSLHIYGPSNNSTTLPRSESLPLLRQEIRRRSRQLIGSIVAIAGSDASFIDWAVNCAGSIVHISGQPITTYPELVPLVERAFDKPGESVIGLGAGNFSLNAAILLGESGLRLPDLLGVAKRGFLEKNPSSSTAEFERGVQCLIAVAQHSPEAVKRLSEILRNNWDAIVSLQEIADDVHADVGASVSGLPARFETAQEQERKRRCFRLIYALSSIGVPAKESIPLLKEIAESPKSSIPDSDGFGGGVFGGGGYGGQPTLTLGERAKLAIKQIQEAKPKPEPEPLPD